MYWVSDKEVEMRLIALALIVFSSIGLFAKPVVLSSSELILEVPVDNGELSIRYSDASGEGRVIPSTLYIDQNASLWFDPKNRKYRDPVFGLKVSEGKLEKTPKFPLGEHYYYSFSALRSQNGYVLRPGAAYKVGKLENEMAFHQFADGSEERAHIFAGYLAITEDGYSVKALFYLGESGLEMRPVDVNIDQTLREKSGKKLAIKNRKMYLNDMLFFPLPRIRYEAYLEADFYRGKLKSGHDVYFNGLPCFGWIKIVDGSGRVVMTAVADFDYIESEDRPARGWYSISAIGPWGELYSLVQPEWKKDKNGNLVNSYEPEIGSSAKLVVIRDHLKHFGILNDGNVRLRALPSTSAAILGSYQRETGFLILEKGNKEETIAGATNYWYKVRLLDGTEGWFFGAFVHNLYDGPTGSPPPWPNVDEW